MNVCGREIRVDGRVVRIARLDAEKYRFLEDPEIFLGGLRECGARVDLFTFIQKLPESAPKFRYPMELDNLAALPVSTFEQWWTKQVDAKTRNMVRKAEKKGVVVREVAFDDGLVRGIREIYNECPVRQGRRFTHYGKDLETVRKEESTYLEGSVFLGAFLGEKLIGFVKMVPDESGMQAGLMNIVSMMRHRDKAPTNALVAEAVRACAARAISYLVYANFAYGKKQRDSVADFKEHNGFLRMDVPRYYVPLTRVGRLALRFGLHHNLADRFPEPVVSRLRGLRNAWYERNLKAVTGLGA
jgi:hypothetical protein